MPLYFRNEATIVESVAAQNGFAAGAELTMVFPIPADRDYQAGEKVVLLFPTPVVVKSLHGPLDRDELLALGDLYARAAIEIRALADRPPQGTTND